jgi:outer membrane protein assembly factor BamA
VFANASFNRKFNKNWTWTAGYNLEVNRIEDLYITDPEEIERIAVDSNYLISSMDSEVVRDTTDSDLYPTKGSLVSVSIELASNIFGSEIDFFKPALELVRYQPITDNILLAGRIGFQTIQEVEDTEDIPIFKRLFLGGSNTVRGYGYQKLGPMDENGKPLGGLTSVNANLELRYPIYNKISGVVFLDMGLLDEESFRQDLSDMRYGCGAGIRYNTIIGPVRVDLGYKLNPPREEIEDRWMIHFSIGQAF